MHPNPRILHATLLAGIVSLGLGCRDDQVGTNDGETETDSGPTSADSSASASASASATMTESGSGSTTGTTAPTSETSGSESGDETEDPPDDPPPPTSPKANVRFKGPRRLANDLAQTLGLDPADVCDELDGLSCTDDVHAVTLGGVEPWNLGIYEPAKHSSVTSPIAVDRVVLEACIRAVDRDLAGSPKVFDLTLDGSALDVDDPSVEATITGLYNRAFLREPDAHEIDALVDLYADIEASSTSAPARDWAVATCFASLTTLEFLFY